MQQTAYVWDLQWDSFAIDNWFCGVTQLLFLQTRWSLVSRLRLTQVVGTWEPGGEKMERQRRNVESKRKGREEE